MHTCHTTHTLTSLHVPSHTLTSLRVPSHTLTDSIVSKIKEAGFEIALQKELTLSQEQAAEFYKEHEGKDYFESLCAHMSR